MLSESNPASNDSIITLCSGQLTIDMPSRIYQRSGLPNGTSIPSGGRKHTQSRFRVQYDLRSPSMVRGKKGFDRLVRASIEVEGLMEARSWCFVDLGIDKKIVRESRTSDDDLWTDRPIAKHHPMIVDIFSEQYQLVDVRVPDSVSRPVYLESISTIDDATHEIGLEEDIYEIIEWLDLAKLQSSRITAADSTDSFICNYALPGDEDKAETTDLVMFTWKGLMSKDWIVLLLIEVIRISRMIDSRDWACLSVNAHRTEAVGQTDGYHILLHPINDTIQGTGEDDTDAMQVDDQNEDVNKKGLQSCMCFQFIDSVVL